MKRFKPGFGLRYEILALVACILWGSAFAGAKIGFVYAGPITLSGIRFTLAGLLLVPVLLVMRVDIKGALHHWRFMLGFGLMQTYLQYGLFFMGLSKVPGAVAAIITGMGPLFVALMAHFTMPGDRFTVRKSVAVALGFAGVLFLRGTKGGLTHTGGAFYAGVVLLLCSNVTGSYTN
ncbi:MAG: DMT family transporter, partial [Rikenellaceae bacterium]|nr:DMT family transporter [Rikenellaceae bacterium]